MKNMLNKGNPLTPDVAAQVLSKGYNMERTVGSMNWLMSKQPGWRGVAVPDAKPEDVERIKETLADTAATLGMDEAATGKVWAGLEPFLKNPEFTKFVLDTHAAESKFFFSWLACVPKAITLEAHFGYAPDLTGNFRAVPDSDPFWYWTQADPGLNLVGYRYEETQKLLAGRETVLDLASGWFQWLRHGNYQPSVAHQVIYSCDLDPAADTKFVLNPGVAGYSLSDAALRKLEINHFQLDVRLMINRMIAEGRKFDAVDAGGILSYMMDDYDWVVERVVTQLLKPGGVFIHDLQLMHWCMKRDGAMFGWNKAASNIQLMDSPEVAKARVDKAFSAVQQHAMYQVSLDESNEEPLAVLVTAQRRNNSSYHNTPWL